MASCDILNICDNELRENSRDWLLECQGYQGGFSQEPGDECHGGYAFCGVASLILLQNINETINHCKFNLESLIRWSVSLQMSYSGGFQGRTHKLVDGCYSFWVGALFPMLQFILQKKNYYLLSKKNNHQTQQQSQKNDKEEIKDDNNNHDNTGFFFSFFYFFFFFVYSLFFALFHSFF